MRPNQKQKKSQGFWATTWQGIPFVAGFILGILFLGYLFFNEQGLPLYLEMVKKDAELIKQTQQLEKSNQTLRESIDRIQHDPSELEQLARDRLGMVRDGEVVYQFVEPKSSDHPQ